MMTTIGLVGKRPSIKQSAMNTNRHTSYTARDTPSTYGSMTKAGETYASPKPRMWTLFTTHLRR